MPIIIVVIGVLILGGLMYAVLTPNSIVVDNTVEEKSFSQVASAEQSEEFVERYVNSNTQYVDGTYETSLEYEIPYGYVEPISVTMSIEEGVIIATEVQFETLDYVSTAYQQIFEDLYKEQVIGIPLNDAPISRVGGASLTTKGFNQALKQIQEEARI